MPVNAYRGLCMDVLNLHPVLAKLLNINSYNCHSHLYICVYSCRYICSESSPWFSRLLSAVPWTDAVHRTDLLLQYRQGVFLSFTNSFRAYLHESNCLQISERPQRGTQQTGRLWKRIHILPLLDLSLCIWLNTTLMILIGFYKREGILQFIIF